MKNIRSIKLDEKDSFRYMFYAYLYEISKYDKTIEYDNMGNPNYKWLDSYWEEEDRYPLYLIVDGQVVGFTLFRKLGDKKYEIAEYYIIPKYRGQNLGIDFANMLAKKFGGEIEISTNRNNTQAVEFWTKFTSTYDLCTTNNENDRIYWSIRV